MFKRYSSLLLKKSITDKMLSLWIASLLNLCVPLTSSRPGKCHNNLKILARHSNTIEKWSPCIPIGKPSKESPKKSLTRIKKSVNGSQSPCEKNSSKPTDWRKTMKSSLPRVTTCIGPDKKNGKMPRKKWRRTTRKSKGMPRCRNTSSWRPLWISMATSKRKIKFAAWSNKLGPARGVWQMMAQIYKKSAKWNKSTRKNWLIFTNSSRKINSKIWTKICGSFKKKPNCSSSLRAWTTKNFMKGTTNATGNWGQIESWFMSHMGWTCNSMKRWNKGTTRSIASSKSKMGNKSKTSPWPMQIIKRGWPNRKWRRSGTMSNITKKRTTLWSKSRRL